MSHLKTSFEGKKKSISEFHVSVGNESFFSLSLSLSLSLCRGNMKMLSTAEQQQQQKIEN